MAQEISRVKLRYRELVMFPEDGLRHELIDGEHFVTPSPTTRHQQVLTDLLSALATYLKEHDSGQVFPAPCDVVLSEFDVVQPDLLVLTKANADRITEANIQGAPDLVVEILSPSTRSRDRGLKLRLYEKFRVREYWIVDPEVGAVEVHRLTGDELQAQAALTGEATLTSPLFPGLEIELDSIF